MIRRLIFGSMSPTSRATRSAIQVSGLTAARAVARQPAERDGLPVVALLDAGVEVGVAIERDEELRQQLLGSGDLERSRREVRGKIRPQVLVEATEADVVVPGEPDHGLQQPQRLERFVERPRRLRRDALQDGRDVVPTEAARLGRVAGGQREHGVDRLDRSVEELDRGGVPGQPLRVRVSLATRRRPRSP